MTNKSNNINSNNQFPVGVRVFLIILAFFISTTFFSSVGLLMVGLNITDFDAIKSETIDKRVLVDGLNSLGTVIVVFFFLKYIDLKPIKSIGLQLKYFKRDILGGLIMVLLIFGIGSLFLMISKHVNFHFIEFNFPNISLSFLLFIFISINEELLFRGYILNNLLTVLNKPLALLISSTMFSLMHTFNPNVSITGLLNIFLSGILFGLTYIYTKKIWFPISIHLFWNFIQGPVLGYAVSGNNLKSLFEIETTGNKILTGGEFGFEGSIICSVLVILTIIILISKHRKKTNHFTSNVGIIRK